MLYGLMKNIMVESIVAILLSTSTIGNTTTETKTVEDIDDNNTTKIEETVTEKVIEEEEVKEEETEIKTEEATKEEVIEEEEDVYEWNDETIAEEIANNPNFEEQYNELLDIYNQHNKIIYYRSPNYMKEQHAQLKNEWRKEWTKQLYAMELDKNSILNELRFSLIALVRVDRDEHCRDIISRINNNL